MTTFPTTPGNQRIVITGAPASAKSTIIERLKAEPWLAGFLFFDELARQLLQENPDWRNDWHRFHHEIYHRQRERENAVVGWSFITDRGTIDAFAFHPKTMQEVNTTLQEEYARYDLALHLGSAAALGEQFYTRDAIRQETVEASLSIEHNLQKAYSAHPGYRFIEATPDIEQKYEQVRNEILNRLAPVPNLSNNERTLHEHKG